MTEAPKKTFWILFFVVFIDLIGFGIVFPLLPLYSRQFHVSTFELGLVVGIYSLMQFLFAPVLGRWSDKVGRRPVLLISMLGTAFSFFMLAWSKTFWWFLIARAIDGIAGSNIATAQAYIADISPKEQRTRNLGMWLGAAFGLGFAVGPCFGGVFQLIAQKFLPTLSFNLPFLLAGILALANWIMAFTQLPESLPFNQTEHLIGRRTFSFGIIGQRLTSSVGLLILTYALVIFSFSQMEGTFSFLSRDKYQLPDIAIYGLFAYLGIVMSIVQGGMVRRLAPKMGDKTMTFMGCVMMVVGLGMLPFFHAWWVLLIGAGLLAAGESFASTAAISGISKGAGDHIQGETMGVTQSLASLSRFAGPALAGYLYAGVGGAVSTYLIAALIMLIAAGLCQGGFNKAEAVSPAV